ncbi:helix-turn-helix domain-containing protein [Rhizobium leguminosarum]|uniref:Helix-turn-helix domain-containing protein n=1 Tax=Rhizobium leguminosarum TaxID=384 RepID=A0A7X0DWA4_RHILE|nr:helix-turn-helix domain-containing protein [Rhizobium leguminosarum]MBB6224594.1 hypothetical protein [Rhizobium leguminosarum]
MDHLDKVYTADEAAERLRLTNRGVIKIARKYGCCSRVGRDYLFSEQDLLALWEAIREPATSPKPATVKVAPVGDWMKENSWMFRPSVSVDGREMAVLRFLSSQKGPRSCKQINRAGPRTVESFLKQGFVEERARDAEGNPLIVITDKGREQIAKVDRWIKERAKHGKGAGGWDRQVSK